MPRTVAVLALLVLAACASAPPPAPTSLAGSYQLVQVNGHALPTASPNEGSITVAGASLQLREGIYVMEMRASGPDGAAMTRAMHGIYTDANGQLAFTPDGDSPGDPVTFSYTLQGSTLTLRDPESHTWLFRRD
jgi:hypothetical protein